MNLNKKNIALIALLMLLLACTTKKAKEKTDVFSAFRGVIKSEVEKYPEIPLKIDKQIKIEIDNINKNVLSYSPVQFTKLFFNNTDVLVGEVNKVLVFQDYLYMCDHKTKTVFKSTLDGQFISSFREVGRGKGEYLNLSDFSIDRKNKWLVIGDVKMRKLLFYNLDGTFIKEKRFPIWYKEFTILKNGDFCFLTLGKNGTGYKIITTNAKLELKGKAIPANEAYRLNAYPMKNSLIHTYKNQSIIAMPFVNTIFQLENDSLSHIYNLDLGEKGFIYDDSRHFKIDLLKKEMDANPNKSMRYTGNYIQNNKYSIFEFTYRNKGYIITYNKKSKEAIRVNSNLLISGQLHIPFPCYSINNKFVSIVEAEWLLNKKEELMELYDMQDLFNNLDVNSNPVLIKFSLNEND